MTRKYFEFVECDSCKPRPGSPQLCGGCIINRQTIAEANRLLNESDASRCEGWGAAADNEKALLALAMVTGKIASLLKAGDR